MQFVPIVTINIVDVVRTGNMTLIVRCHPDDKALIDKAAATVGMRQGEFLRTVLVQAARQVLADNTTTSRA